MKYCGEWNFAAFHKLDSDSTFVCVYFFFLLHFSRTSFKIPHLSVHESKNLHLGGQMVKIYFESSFIYFWFVAIV